MSGPRDQGFPHTRRRPEPNDPYRFWTGLVVGAIIGAALWAVTLSALRAPRPWNVAAIALLGAVVFYAVLLVVMRRNRP